MDIWQVRDIGANDALESTSRRPNLRKRQRQKARVKDKQRRGLTDPTSRFLFLASAILLLCQQGLNVGLDLRGFSRARADVALKHFHIPGDQIGGRKSYHI